MTHMAWDFGLVASAIKKIVKGVIPIETIKTLCGKRVRQERIDNEHPTCPRCQQLYQQLKDDTKVAEANLAA